MPTTSQHLARLLASAVAVAAVAVPLLATSVADAATAGSPTLRPDGRPTIAGMQVLSGSLHDHSTDSDGDATSADVVAWEAANHAALGIDFGILTDHSDFFPVTYSTPGADPWNRQAALDQQYTSGDFAFLRGFEWTNDQQNHLNVLGSQNWTDRWTAGEASLHMAPFWAWLSTAPTPDPTGTGVGIGGADGIGQFNHPGDKGALNWDDYAYDAAATKVMATIEIHGDQGKNGLNSSDAGW